MSTPKAEVFFSDMTAAMQEDAVDRASQALMKYTTEYEMAKYIKSDFDAKYPAYWQCIIGNSPLSYFGNYEEKTTFTLLLDLSTIEERKRAAVLYCKTYKFQLDETTKNMSSPPRKRIRRRGSMDKRDVDLVVLAILDLFRTGMNPDFVFDLCRKPDWNCSVNGVNLFAKMKVKGHEIDQPLFSSQSYKKTFVAAMKRNEVSQIIDPTSPLFKNVGAWERETFIRFHQMLREHYSTHKRRN